MAIKQQEKNFLIGVIAFAVLLVLSLLLLPLLPSSQNSAKKDPAPVREKVRVEVAKVSEMPAVTNQEAKKSRPDTKKKFEEKLSADLKPASEATMVLSQATKVPSDYFEDGSGVAPLPRVVERYLESVKNGSRFIGRLEAIALRENKVREEQRQSAKKSQALDLQRGDSTKVISFNMKIDKPYLAANFDAESLDDFKSDILVEWVDAQSDERIELFFTPLIRDGSEGRFRLQMPEDVMPPASNVYVYSATDNMPLIVSGSYSPN